MKKILTKLFILLTLLVITDRVLIYFFTKFIYANTISGEGTGSVNYLLQKKKNTDFIILGNSRAKHQINPALLTNLYNGNGFNAGINGVGGIVYNSILLHLLLSKDIKPKTILLEVDAYPYFTTKDENVADELIPLYPFINESEVLRSYIKNNTGYAEKFKLLFHSYRFNGMFFRVLFNYIKQHAVIDNNGFEGLQGKLDTAGFKLPDDIIKPQSYSQLKLTALVDIVQTCSTNNIKLLVVFAPSYKNSLTSKEGNEMMIELLRKKGVTTVYDFSAIEKIPQLQSNSMWRNATHLNSDGAIIFSRILNEAMAAIP